MGNVSTVLMAFICMMETVFPHVNKDIGEILVLVYVSLVEWIAKIALIIVNALHVLILILFLMANVTRSVHKEQCQ